jgi:hypothetical protein
MMFFLFQLIINSPDDLVVVNADRLKVNKIYETGPEKILSQKIFGCIFAKLIDNLYLY